MCDALFTENLTKSTRTNRNIGFSAAAEEIECFRGKSIFLNNNKVCAPELIRLVIYVSQQLVDSCTKSNWYNNTFTLPIPSNGTMSLSKKQRRQFSVFCSPFDLFACIIFTQFAYPSVWKHINSMLCVCAPAWVSKMCFRA